MYEKNVEIINPKRKVVEDLKVRNASNGKLVASEYFGSKFTYDETFKMFEDYKKAFESLGDKEDEPITISAPTTIASVNAFYGVIDSNHIANMTGPGFLNAFPEKYVRDINCKTVFIFDTFLNKSLIDKLHHAGVKNIIITSVTDYMSAKIKLLGKLTGKINGKDFLDEYVNAGNALPGDMNFIRLKEFAAIGSKIKESIQHPYVEHQIIGYFLTGATTSRMPKAVQLYADGLNKMAEIYKHTDPTYRFGPQDRNLVLVPLFYGTGAIHGMHAGLITGMTNIYEPRYDRFAFGRYLADSKATGVIGSPSMAATLKNSGLANGSLSHVTYLFIGGEAIMPAQMKDVREQAKRLGIKYVFNGYGMTETFSMSAMSAIDPLSDDDITVLPVAGIKYRIADPITRDVLPDNTRGILEVLSPCATPGYLGTEKNDGLFTGDGWINTGDVAIRYDNERYRIFGRYTDSFTNSGEKYYMFDIEEKVLEHPGVLEAEVIKLKAGTEEYPAIVVVPNEDWKDKLDVITADVSKLTLPGMIHLVGIRFIDVFETSLITGKRDYLALENNRHGYYKYDVNSELFYQTDLPESSEPVVMTIQNSDIKIAETG